MFALNCTQNLFIETHNGTYLLNYNDVIVSNQPASHAATRELHCSLRCDQYTYIQQTVNYKLNQSNDLIKSIRYCA